MDGQLVRFTCPVGLADEVKSFLKNNVVDITIPTTGGRVPSGSYGRYTRYDVVQHDYVVSQIDNGRVVASQTDFEWRGLWWQVSAAPLIGHGGFCLGAKDRSMLEQIARGK
mgnify:CR=1 FL=1